MLDSKRRSKLEKSKGESFDRERFTSSLNILESERHNLLESMKELEKRYEMQVEKNQELGRNLGFQSEHIGQVEAEKKILTEKIRKLQERLTEFEMLNSAMLQERGSLKASLSKIEEEKERAVLKFGDSEMFIGQLSQNYLNEKETIVGVHGKHTRLLTSKILFDTIARIALIRKNSVFNGIQRVTKENNKTALICIRLMNRMYWKRIGNAFESIKKDREIIRRQVVKEKIIQKFFCEKIKRKVLQELCKRVKIAKNIRKNIEKGMRKIWLVEKLKGFLKKLRGLEKWKSMKTKEIFVKKVLGNVVGNKHKKHLELFLSKWKEVHQVVKANQAKEDLATELSAFSLKQSVFYELRRITQLASQKSKVKALTQGLLINKNKSKVFSEIKKQKDSQNLKIQRLRHIAAHFASKSQKKFLNAWKKLKADYSKNNCMNKVFNSKNKILSRKELEKVFLAWKLYFCSGKLEKAAAELSKEKPKRMEFEQAYKRLFSDHNQTVMAKAITNMLKSCKNSIRSYFIIWHNKVYQHEVGKKRIARLFMKSYSNTLEFGFKKWKLLKQNLDFADVLNINSISLQENQALVDHIISLETCLNETIREKKIISLLTMKRLFIAISKKSLQYHLRTWAFTSYISSRKIFSTTKFALLLEKILKVRGFKTLIINNFSKSAKKIRQRKLYIQTFKKWTNINSMIFGSWVNYVRLNKYHRSKMAKILTKKYKNTSMGAFKLLKDFLRVIQNDENFERYQVLGDHLNQVQGELEETCNTLSVQIDSNWQLQQVFTSKVIKHGFNTLLQIHFKTLKKAMEIWVKTAEFKESVQGKMKKLILFDRKSYYRFALKQWKAYNSFMSKQKNTNSVNTLVVEKKIIRRELGQVKNKLEETINEKNVIIETHKFNEAKLGKIIEKNLDLISRRKNDCTSQPKSHWAFNLWKELFKNKKKYLTKVLKIAQKQKFRSNFNKIKAFSEKIQKSREIQQFILELFISFRTRKLKHSWARWKTNHFKYGESFQLNELEFAMEKLRALGIRYSNSKKQSISKALAYITDRKKYRVLQSWSVIKKQLKAIKRGKEKFAKVQSKFNAKYALSEIRLYSKKKLLGRNAKFQVGRYRLAYLLSFTFANWKFYHLASHALGKSLEKIVSKSNLTHVYSAFGLIRTTSLYNSTSLNWKNFSKTQMMKNILASYSKADLLTRFSRWRNLCKFISKVSKKLGWVITSTNSRLQSKRFKKWSHKVSVEKTVELTEINGKSANRNRTLMKTLQVYHKFLKQEGLTSEHIDTFLIEQLPIRKTLSRKNLKRSDLLPYTLMIWRSLMIKKKKILRCSFRMLAYRRKGKLMQGLNTWKRCYPLFSLNIKSMPRRVLLDTLANMDRDINSLQSSLKEKHISLRYLESYSEVLEENVRKGLNQALANLAGGIKKTLKYSVSTWFANTQSWKINGLIFKLRELEDELIYIRRKCKDFDIENKELLIENKNLMQSNYEGRELGNITKTLTFQKRSLEEEIKEKSDTIRRLIQENRHLALELQSYN